MLQILQQQAAKDMRSIDTPRKQNHPTSNPKNQFCCRPCNNTLQKYEVNPEFQTQRKQNHPTLNPMNEVQDELTEGLGVGIVYQKLVAVCGYKKPRRLTGCELRGG